MGTRHGLMLSALTTPKSKEERRQSLAKGASRYAAKALQDERQAPRDDRDLVRRPS